MFVFESKLTTCAAVPTDSSDTGLGISHVLEISIAIPKLSTNANRTLILVGDAANANLTRVFVEAVLIPFMGMY